MEGRRDSCIGSRVLCACMKIVIPTALCSQCTLIKTLTNRQQNTSEKTGRTREGGDVTVSKFHPHLSNRQFSSCYSSFDK